MSLFLAGPRWWSSAQRLHVDRIALPIPYVSACHALLSTLSTCPAPIPPRAGKEELPVTKQRTRRVLTPAGLQLQSKLLKGTADPLATLRNGLEMRTADVETAGLCLEAYANHLKAVLPRRQLRQHIRNEGIGGLTLKWLWSEEHCVVDRILGDLEFTTWLCYFAVAEGLDDLLLDWIEQPLAPATKADKADPDRWRGYVLRNIISGHLRLDITNCADEALKFFFDVEARQKEARRRRLHTPMAQIKLGPAVVELQKVFPTGVYFRTDPRLFDELVRFITEPFRGSEYQKASIRLVHPTTPDAAPALSYIRSHMEHLSKAEYHAKFGPRLNVSTNMYFFLRRTERTLREQDSPEDADYVDRLLHEFVEGQEYQALEAKYWSVVNSTKGPRDKWLKASRKLDDGDEGKKPLRPVWRKR